MWVGAVPGLRQMVAWQVYKTATKDHKQDGEIRGRMVLRAVRSQDARSSVERHIGRPGRAADGDPATWRRCRPATTRAGAAPDETSARAGPRT